MSNEKQKEIIKNFNKRVRHVLSRQPNNFQEQDLRLIKKLEEACERDKELSKGSPLEAKHGNKNTPACSEFSPKILGTKATTIIIDDPLKES